MGKRRAAKPVKKRKTKISLHDSIVDKVSRWLKKHDQNITVPNCPHIAKELTTGNNSGEIPDVIGWNYWTSVLVEVKTSRRDFLADAKKPFRKHPSKGMGEFRYYCCPEGLVETKELPPKWGLLYMNDGGKIDIIKKAAKQRNSMNDERTMLLSMLRRSKN